MAKVVGFESAGCAYRDGQRVPGWNRVFLDDGSALYAGENIGGFDDLLNFAACKGHSITEMRQRLDVWVKTGVMPPVGGVRAN